jgi:hypothetical protein
MAKKLTQAQAEDVRGELGIETNVAPVRELRSAAPRSVMPSNAQIVSTRELEDAGPQHSLGDEWAAAFRVDNTAGRLLSQEEVEHPIDLNYDPMTFVKDNQGRIDALMGADREEIAQDLGSAWSASHAESRLGQMERDFADEQLLASGGGTALLARLGAALLDPVDIAVALSTGGVGGALAKGGRFGKILTTAVSASAAGGATEALLSSDNVMRDETDVAFAALAGLTVGGALGTWTSRELKEFTDFADDVAKGNIDVAAQRLLGDSAGAAKAKPQSMVPNKPLYDNPDEAIDAMEAPEFKFKFLNKMLGNIQGRLFHSESETVRKVSSALFEGGFLKNRGTRALTVENRATMLDMVFQRNIYAETMSDFKGWAKRMGHGAVKREMTTSVGEDFYSQVGKAMRGVTDDISEEASNAAGKIKQQMDNIYKLAQEAGVEGFEEGRLLDDYFPRVLNKGKFNEARLKYGDDALSQFYRDAIRKAQPEIEDALALKIAKAYVRTMREKVAGIEDDLLHGIRLDDIDRMRAGWDGQPPREVLDLIEELEAIKKADLNERGTISHAKHRIRFDELHADDIAVDGVTAGRLQFTDLYENDARLVLARYSRAMHGHIAMAEKLGVKSRMDFERLTKQMASEAEDLGEDARKVEMAFRDGYNLMLGQPIERWNPNGDAAQLSRMFSAYNYGGRGGQFGVNALAELGNVVAMGGFRSMLRIIPDLKRVMQRAADGELEHPIARFVELNFAPGVNTMITPAVRNLDELAEGFGGTSVIQQFAAKMDPYLKSLGRQTSITSGLGPITDATQRLAAVRHVERLAKFAKRAPTEKQRERLRASGISNEMQDRIFAMLKEGAAGKYRKGRLVDIDMDRWTDSEALAAFSESSQRVTRDAIQMPDISTSTTLFNHPAGRLIFQFMRFPMDAVNKQLLRHMHHMDGESATAAVSSFGIASLVYMAQQSIEYANDPETLKERLDPKQIAKIGFMRTGYSSLLPGVMDSALWAGGFDPQFSMGRSSGLTTIFPIAANPTTTLLKNAATFGGGITRSALQDDIQFSQADMRAGLQTLPYYRALGLKNLWHSIEQQFPESRKQE